MQNYSKHVAAPGPFLSMAAKSFNMFKLISLGKVLLVALPAGSRQRQTRLLAEGVQRISHPRGPPTLLHWPLKAVIVSALKDAAAASSANKKAGVFAGQMWMAIVFGWLKGPPRPLHSFSMISLNGWAHHASQTQRMNRQALLCCAQCDCCRSDHPIEA